MPTPPRRLPLPLLIASALLTLQAQAADPAVPEGGLQTVVVSATNGSYRKDESDKGTATAVAPTQASLDATQPQSIITREFIELSVAPTAEYTRVVNIAPSLSGDSANGPGLSETKSTMRGFSDDQYNVTYDGIPFADTNNPAHHSTSYFPGAVIGGAIVERGPGNASNVGYATFGGSINLYSKAPAREAQGSVFGSLGKWHTSLAGIALETGRMSSLDNATLQLNLQRLSSDGYLTGNRIKSENYFLKFQRRLLASTKLTIVATDNEIKYVQPDNSKGPTLAQVAQFGKNYSLNEDPNSFNYSGYNYTHKNTDFSYLRLETAWGDGLQSENTVYTYAYNNQTISSTDPTGASAPGTKAGPAGNKNIPGIDKQNKYRVYGDLFKLTQTLRWGLLRGGVWLEHSNTDRHQYDIDLSLGNIRDPRETKPTPLQFPSVLFDQQSSIRNVQPFLEAEWAVTPDLRLSPGFKAVRITRNVDAAVNQSTRQPQHTSVDYHTGLPFLTANQQLGDSLAVYAQYAKGFQIPDLKSFYIADPTHNSPEPQLSTNYQLGIVGKREHLTWDLDVYQIDFKNKYVSNGLGGTAAAYVNIGGATYKGLEGQLTWVLGHGLALYVNGSRNVAEANDTGKQISGAPDMTAALGALYHAGPWSASLIGKRTGKVRQVDYDASKPAAYDSYQTPAYTSTDLSLAYNVERPGLGIGVKSLKLQLNVFNLQNHQAIVNISTGKTVAFDQYTFQAPRSYQVSLKAGF
ncbi:TonB-dependent receptor [Massilia sp. TS11]|uniref:TonB-dependent receptor n=1 Tax=Massilia sp. TS11 TaxID=2908003 RepID=UPI001EDC2931|nr:TonB-dependent receptor [Massilia sp. TS11]MCG2585786.1 TonB-dependent receptor [Massilia sp. TS11]